MTTAVIMLKKITTLNARHGTLTKAFYQSYPRRNEKFPTHNRGFGGVA